MSILQGNVATHLIKITLRWGGITFLQKKCDSKKI